jgi:hypothetical protein
MRHGIERPEEIRVSLARRRLERELATRAWGVSWNTLQALAK